jgi:O-antigen ligase
LFGRNYLRIYSTFSHPNSFAGFLGVSIIFLITNYLKKINPYKFVGLSVILLAFILTFSLSAYVAMALCLFMYFVLNMHKVNVKWTNVFLVLIFLVSFLFSIFSKPILDSGISLSKSFNERLDMGNVAGKIFSEKWVTGTGLNTFIVNEVSFASADKGVWLLQPVHNIFLLIISETGILGAVLLFYLISFTFAKNSNNTWGILVIFFVLITGLFDHYWFTIQQNMLLSSLLLGISFRKN